MDGMETLHALKGMRSDPAGLIRSGHGYLEAAMQTLEGRAFASIEKPCSTENRLSIVRRAFARRAERDITPSPRLPRHAQPRFLGHSPQINAIRRRFIHAWASDAVVMIQDESRGHATGLFHCPHPPIP